MPGVTSGSGAPSYSLLLETDSRIDDLGQSFENAVEAARNQQLGRRALGNREKQKTRYC